MQNDPHLKGLYAITPDSDKFPNFLNMIDAVLDAGIAVLQLRDKNNRLNENQQKSIRSLCHNYSTRFIVNDDIDLALSLKADGVHIGQNDHSIKYARETLGRDALIGVSCYNSLETAADAIAIGADYIAFGSFYSSTTKPEAVNAPITILKEAKERFPIIPIVAIGGISPANAPPLLEAGADMLAVINGIFSAPEPVKAVNQYQLLFEAK